MIEHTQETTDSRRRGDNAVRRSLAFLDDLVRDVPTRNFAVRLWDGTSWELRPGEYEFTLVLRHPGALRAMFWRPSELRLAEAYIYDDFGVEGDLRAFVAVGYDLLLGAAEMDRAQRARQAGRLLALPAERRARGGAGLSSLRACATRSSGPGAGSPTTTTRRTSSSSSSSIRSWSTPARTSPRRTRASTRRRSASSSTSAELRLRPGDRLLDVGCGWGSLALYAAERYGVNVLGVTLSGEQAELANRRIDAAGLGDRARVELLDFREVDEPEGFDKILALGFIEPIGEELLPDCFSHLFGLLRPGGVFVNHAIARGRLREADRRSPSSAGMCSPTPSRTPIGGVIRAAEDVGFEVRDVESLREHYILTCSRWLDRLEANHEEARRLTSETTYRIFRLYLALGPHVRDRRRQSLPDDVREAGPGRERAPAHPFRLVRLEAEVVGIPAERDGALTGMRRDGRSERRDGLDCSAGPEARHDGTESLGLGLGARMADPHEEPGRVGGAGSEHPLELGQALHAPPDALQETISPSTTPMMGLTPASSPARPAVFRGRPLRTRGSSVSTANTNRASAP